MKLLTGLISLAFSGLALAAGPSYQLQVHPPVLNTAIPSGSGMSPTFQQHYLVVGDDSPYLFEVDARFQVVKKTLIKDYPVNAQGRIDKKIKPDFEAMTPLVWNKQLWSMVIGSGSKPDLREYGYLLSYDGKQKIEFRLTNLYKQFFVAGGLTPTQTINIEGLTVDHQYMYFLNRGNSATNMIFRVRLSDMSDYLAGKVTQVAEVKKFDVKLPVIDKFEAGLSGADYWPEARALVYTASVEATGDAYGDGAILGSFVGVIPLNQLREGQTLDLSRSAMPVMVNGKPVLTKIESIAFQKADEHEVRGALISDNDQGASEFFGFRLRRKD